MSDWTSISSTLGTTPQDPSSPRLGVISVLIRQSPMETPGLEPILTQYGGVILARFEHLAQDKGLKLLCLVVEASTNELGALTGKLGMLQGLRVKSILLR